MTGEIRVQGVTKRYESSGEQRMATVAVSNVSFEVQRGAFVTVVGPSGCGKTTLIRLIGGLEPTTDGEIRVAGTPVSGPSPDRALVFQDHRLFPWLRVRENVAFGLRESGTPTNERRERVDDLLDLVGLADYAQAYPKALSGGMKQRVGLARALAVEPAVMLLDEPFASVDAQTRRRLQRELLRIWRETETTVLFVTHDIEEAVFLGDRVLVMTDAPGQLHETMPIELPRPRSRASEKFTARKSTILELIDTSL